MFGAIPPWMLNGLGSFAPPMQQSTFGQQAALNAALQYGLNHLSQDDVIRMFRAQQAATNNAPHQPPKEQYDGPTIDGTCVEVKEGDASGAPYSVRRIA